MIINDIEKLDVNSHLSRIRTKNEYEHQQRLEDIYTKLPEVKAIDNEITTLSIADAKRRISGGAADEQLSAKISELSDKKKSSLVLAGYPADYLDPIYDCKLCQDWGNVGNAPCSCIKKLRIEQLYKKSNLKGVFERENFETFNLDYYNNDNNGNMKRSPHENAVLILENAKKFVNNYEQEHGNILMYGDTGLGKTFLSNCIAKEFLDQGRSVLYLSANELFEEILGNYIISHDKSTALESIYEYIFTSELLIIDDLGTEVLRSFVVSQLFEIINKRAISKHSTIITTNLDPHSIEDRYTSRIASRLYENYVPYYFYGDDIRSVKHCNR